MYFIIAMEWFRINSLKANPGKLQFMVLGTGKVANWQTGKLAKTTIICLLMM